MKTLLISFILVLSISGNTQTMDDWQIGVNVNPFIFHRINSSFLFETDKQNYPNGLGYGITIEKIINGHFGFKLGFEKSIQSEKYFFDEVSDDNNHMKSSFKYDKVPLTIQYYYPLNSNKFLVFNQGIQFSFLKYYKTVFKGNYQSTTLTSDYHEFISYQQPELNYYVNGSFENLYHNKNLFGLTGSVGLKGFLSDKFSYSTNIRYDFDFSDADNIPYFTTDTQKTQNTTHNLRIGIDMGLQYHFNLSSNRQSKCPK